MSLFHTQLNKLFAIPHSSLWVVLLQNYDSCESTKSLYVYTHSPKNEKEGALVLHYFSKEKFFKLCCYFFTANLMLPFTLFEHKSVEIATKLAEKV